jgi:hypothetical protein
VVPTSGAAAEFCGSEARETFTAPTDEERAPPPPPPPPHPAVRKATNPRRITQLLFAKNIAIPFLMVHLGDPMIFTIAVDRYDTRHGVGYLYVCRYVTELFQQNECHRACRSIFL